MRQLSGSCQRDIRVVPDVAGRPSYHSDPKEEAGFAAVLTRGPTHKEDDMDRDEPTEQEPVHGDLEDLAPTEEQASSVVGGGGKYVDASSPKLNLAITTGGTPPPQSQK